eukprot:1545550-Alexandrium_andersonii.AAC.1
MSASLVGSEMCIRDSDRPATLGEESAAGRNRAAGFGATRHLTAHSPVSYTHLTLPTICSV